MKLRPTLAVAGILALLLSPADPAGAQAIVARHRCSTTYQGVPYQGLVQVERWSYHDTHRIYGRFADPRGTLVELEVFTNQPGGVGGLWVNHARHRETRIHLQWTGRGYLLRTEDGGAAVLACR